MEDEGRLKRIKTRLTKDFIVFRNFLLLYFNMMHASFCDGKANKISIICRLYAVYTFLKGTRSLSLAQA